MQFWPSRRNRVQNTALSISDPALVGWFSIGGPNYAGVDITEGTALGLTAVWRAVNLIAGTLASLPLRSLRDTGGGMRERVSSIFDNPDGDDGQTAFEWKETLFIHQLLHGRTHALKVRNEAGAIVRLPLFHPLTVSVELPTIDEIKSGTGPRGGLWFKVTLADGRQVRYDQTDMLYIPGPSTQNGIGISPIAMLRNALGTAIAADRSAARSFSTGASISGIVTPEDANDVDDQDVKAIRSQIDQTMTGWENAGGIAVVNRRLKVQPFTMSLRDAQFIESRQFEIEEVARIWGVPPHALMQTDKQTSWGSGVAEQNRGLGRTVLAPWATRAEQRMSRLLPRPRFVEFDFAGLERPSPETEIELLIKQVQAGLLTLDEARAIRNLPPLPKTPAPAKEEDDDAPPSE